MTGSTAAVAAPLVVAEDISLRFGAVTAFADVSFSVGEGELFAVIGPNGAGKTSLFNVLSRIYRPSSGRVLLRGADMASLRVRDLARAGVARTFQNLGLFPTMTVLDNVLVGRHHAIRSGTLRDGLLIGPARREEARNRTVAHEVMAFAGVEAAAHLPVAALSYGTRKRVELARALAMEPRLLLLDEPVAGMNAEERADVTALVRRLHSERGLTVILVEHDMGMVMQVAQRILVLDFGRVIATGTPAQVQRDETVVRAYLGESIDGDEAAAS